MPPGLPPYTANALQGFQTRDSRTRSALQRHAITANLLVRLKAGLIADGPGVWDQRCIWPPSRWPSSARCVCQNISAQRPAAASDDVTFGSGPRTAAPGSAYTYINKNKTKNTNTPPPPAGCPRPPPGTTFAPYAASGPTAAPVTSGTRQIGPCSFRRRLASDAEPPQSCFTISVGSQVYDPLITYRIRQPVAEVGVDDVTIQRLGR